MLLNCYNGKFYVGSSVNLKKREKEHFNSLRANHHANKHLQNSYNKYGNHDVFAFIVICFCDNDKLVDLEQWYIDTLEPEYNICHIAGNSLGYKHTEEAKQKISKTNKGRKRSEEHKQKISAANSGKIFTEEHKQKISQNNYWRGKSGINNPNAKRILQLTLEGKVINEFYGAREAYRKTKIDPSSIIKSCKGKLKQTGGYIWKYKDVA